MAELVGDMRKLNCKSIVEKYKIHKEVERGTSCGAAVRKYVFAKQSLFNWIKDKSKIFAAVEGNNLVNLSMFAENNRRSHYEGFSNSRDRVGCYFKVASSQ